MSQYASMKMPAGGDHNKGPALAAVNIVTLCVAAIIVAARVLYRALKIKQTSWDDYMIVLALVAAVVNTAFIMKYVESGGGRHAIYLRLKAVDVAKWSTIAQLPFIVSTTLTKLSIALMILRIKPNSMKLKCSMAPLIAVVVSVNIASIVILAAGCKPFEANWTYTGPRNCWPRQVLKNQNWVQGIVSIVSDFIYTLLPIFVVWGLNITKRQKAAISGLIAIGLLATGCSIARMVIYQNFTNFADSTYGLSELQIWTALEQNLGIMAASLPTLRVFFKELGQALANASRSFIGTWSSKSRSSISNDKSALTGRGSDLERGMPRWNDTHSKLSDVSNKEKTGAEARSFDQNTDMDLQYLGGNLQFQTSRETRI